MKTAINIDTAIRTRMSTRAFTREPIPDAVPDEILTHALADCGMTQLPPWRMHVLQGAPLSRLCDAVCAAHDAVRRDPELRDRYREPYDYYPERWSSPYLERRRENGWGLYGLLGIGKSDKDKMHAQHQRNYRFFDAPIGLFMTVDRGCGGEVLLAAGRYLQAVMLQAGLRGLQTCPQAAWNSFWPIILPQLQAGDDEVLVCGMALGHADPQAPVNGYDTPRVDAAQFCRWLD